MHCHADAEARFAGADEQDALFVQRAPRQPTGNVQAREPHRAGALDVVVEAAQPFAVACQQCKGVGIGEVLELQQHAGKHLFDGTDELFDELVIGRAGKPRHASANVEAIATNHRSVSADVERHRQATRRRDPGARGVEGELADRNAHAVGAEIAEAEDAPAVGGDDHRDVALWPTAQDHGNATAMLGREIKPARPRVQAAPLLARLADGGRVHQRQHLLQVIDHDAVKERFVVALQRRKVSVAVDVRGPAADVLEHTRRLLPQRFDARRQPSDEAEMFTLGVGKRGAAIGEGITQDIDVRGRCGIWHGRLPAGSGMVVGDLAPTNIGCACRPACLEPGQEIAATVRNCPQPAPAVPRHRRPSAVRGVACRGPDLGFEAATRRTISSTARQSLLDLKRVVEQRSDGAQAIGPLQSGHRAG